MRVKFYMRKATLIQFYTNLELVSLFFLCLLGPLHFISGLLFAQNPFLKFAFLSNRLLDIPFLLAFLLYILAHIKIRRLNQNLNCLKFDYIFWSLLITILLISLGFDIFYEHYLPKSI